MILDASVQIGKGGKLKYYGRLTNEFNFVDFGEITELTYSILKRAHEAIKEAIDRVNDHLAEESMTERLAAIEQ